MGDYFILQSGNSYRLTRYVNSALNEGFVPVGGVSVVRAPWWVINSRFIYVQAMAKKEK